MKFDFPYKSYWLNVFCLYMFITFTNFLFNVVF